MSSAKQTLGWCGCNGSHPRSLEGKVILPQPIRRTNDMYDDLSSKLDMIAEMMQAAQMANELISGKDAAGPSMTLIPRNMSKMITGMSEIHKNENYVTRAAWQSERTSFDISASQLLSAEYLFKVAEEDKDTKAIDEALLHLIK
jgi:hypothetical protein